jgi:hypothetical protein
VVALRTQRQGVVVEILIDQKIGMNHNLESIRIDSTDSDSISVQIANRITMGESIRKATAVAGERGAGGGAASGGGRGPGGAVPVSCGATGVPGVGVSGGIGGVMGTCSLADDAVTVHASIMMPNHRTTSEQRFPMCIYDGCILELAATTRPDHTHAHLCLGLIPIHPWMCGVLPTIRETRLLASRHGADK